MSESTIMTSSGAHDLLRLTDRVGPVILYVAAAVVGALSLILGAWQVISILSKSTTDVSIPTESGWGFATVGSFKVESGSWSQVQLTLSGLTSDTIGLLAAGAGLAAVTIAAVSAGVVALTLALRNNNPFRKSLSVVAIATGATLTVGSFLSQLLHGLGTADAARQLNTAFHTNQYLEQINWDPVPWAVGIVVMALAWVFSRGALLQRETDGLI
jgi:hypothetical protein